MGARGGAVRVTVFKCGTCGDLFERRHGGRKAAEDCCNEAVAEAKDRAQERSVKQILARVRKPRVQIKRMNGTEYAVATVRCPRCTNTASVRVEVRSGKYPWSPRVPRPDAKKKAVALAKAQISRHIRSRYSH